MKIIEDSTCHSSSLYWIHLPSHNNIFEQGYIGITNNAKARFNRHLNDAKKGSQYSIHRAIRKYKDELVFSIIHVADYETIMRLETIYRNEINIGWNINAGGQLGSTGRRMKESSKIKMIAKLKKFRHSEESKIKISESLKGKKQSLESRQKHSLVMKKRYANPFEREKKSRAMKSLYEDVSERKKQSDLISSYSYDLYCYKTGDIVAENISLRWWCNHNDCSYGTMMLTTNGKRKQHKGFFAIKKKKIEALNV